MLKAQLEKLLEDERNNNTELKQKAVLLNKEIENLKKEIDCIKNKSKDDLFNYQYNIWKSKNKVFLEKFIK